MCSVLKKAARFVVSAFVVMQAWTSAVAAEKVLRIVPPADLASLDPIVSTSGITMMHAYMIYDTLYALDENFVPQPQMVTHLSVSEDRKTYRFILRDGLKWHDGELVTAEDCVASLKRWMARDAAGQLMNRMLAQMQVIDEKTFELNFKEPYAIVLESLSKTAASIPFMMPKRIAQTDPYKDITEYVGSGPFRFVRDAWVPGNKVVYEKFVDYVPRSEPASRFAGGKKVDVDRVEWIVLRDQQTALSALITGEIDFWSNPSTDLLQVVKAAPSIKTKVINPSGTQGALFFNHLHPPFDKVLARQAMFYLVDQKSYLQAISGDPDYYKVCASFFPCGTPMMTEVGLTALKTTSQQKAKELFLASGWDFAKPIVVLDPTDEVVVHPATIVTVQAMRDIGLNVQVQAMDWATLLKRRISKEPPSTTGWNIVHSSSGSQVVATPVWSVTFSAACEQGLFGWPCDKQLEDLRLKWAMSEGDEAKKKVAAEYSQRAFDTGHHIPLGQWTSFVAYSSKISDPTLTDSVPVFWNIKKSQQ